MPQPELFRALLSHASSTGARSTALQPLMWLSGILTAGLALAATSSTPTWTLVAIAVFLGITISVFLIAYVYFAFKNPDALRSEKYTLSKMAIEKNLIGDNKAGLQEFDDYDNPAILSALPNKQGESQ